MGTGARNRKKKWVPFPFADTTNALEDEPEMEADVNDQSEFPSLGGGSQQPQHQTSITAPGGSYWANNVVRPRSPERRYAGFGRGRVSSSLHQTSGPLLIIIPQAPQPIEDASRDLSFAPGADGYHFGRHAGVSQLSGLAQQQTGKLNSP